MLFFNTLICLKMVTVLLSNVPRCLSTWSWTGGVIEQTCSCEIIAVQRAGKWGAWIRLRLWSI